MLTKVIPWKNRVTEKQKKVQLKIFAWSRVMSRDTCHVCGSNRSSDPGASFHHFPSDSERRSTWLSVFQLEESHIKSYFEA